ncbi:MAG: type II secretion system protein N [Hyphomonas sp.]
MNQLATLLMRVQHPLPHLRLGANLVLAAILGLLAARVVWLLVEPGGAVSQPVPLPASTSNASASSPLASADVVALTRSNRFGAPATLVDVLPDAPATSLNLSLRGVRAVAAEAGEANPLQVSIAIIKTPDGRALTYNPGDTIIDGVTLDRVLTDRVLIRKGGALETLMMESNADALAVLSMPGQEGMIQGGQRLPVVESRPATIDRALLASLNISPVVEEGNLVGYRLTTPGSAAVLSGTGIESGDILTTLDGTPVRDIDMQSVTERLARSPEISMMVRRGNADVPVTLRFPEGE